MNPYDIWKLFQESGEVKYSENILTVLNEETGCKIGLIRTPKEVTHEGETFTVYNYSFTIVVANKLTLNVKVHWRSKALKKYISRLFSKLKPQPWRADKGCVYYSLSGEPVLVLTATENQTLVDDIRYKSGNYFKTMYAAEEVIPVFILNN